MDKLQKLSIIEKTDWHKDVTKELRERQLSQKAFTVWMTGLSGSGKSTLANALEKRLFTLGKHTMLLDGDNIRMGLNKNLDLMKETEWKISAE